MGQQRNYISLIKWENPAQPFCFTKAQLGWEDPLEKGKATHSSTFDWRIPWTEARYSPRGHKELATAEQLTLVIVFFLLSLKTLNF